MPSLATLPSDLRTFAKYHLRRRVYDYPAPETELGVESLGFDLEDYVAELWGFAGDFDVQDEVEVLYRERAHPIVSVSSRANAERTVLVLAGVHGNEHAGLLAVPRILRRFLSETPATRLVVLAPVNPVGAAEQSRYNGDGFDINRDFIRFETVEARLVRDVIAREAPAFIVSLHEGPQDASFMFANQHVGDETARDLLAAVADGGSVLAERDYFGLKLKRRGYSPSTRTTRAINAAWARTLRMKTTGGFAGDLGIPEITLESSWRQLDSDARIRPHVDLVAALCTILAAG